MPKDLVCAVCGALLDPEKAVFLGWGERFDGGPGPGWVVGCCPATIEEVQSGVGSQCAHEARRRIESTGEDVIPATYEEWLGDV